MYGNNSQHPDLPHGAYRKVYYERHGASTIVEKAVTELVDNPRQLQIKLMKCYDTPPPDEDELMKKINLEASDILKDTMHYLNTNLFNNDL